MTGWELSNGTDITNSTVFLGNTTIYAQWHAVTDYSGVLDSDYFYYAGADTTIANDRFDIIQSLDGFIMHPHLGGDGDLVNTGFGQWISPGVYNRCISFYIPVLESGGLGYDDGYIDSLLNTSYDPGITGLADPVIRLDEVSEYGGSYLGVGDNNTLYRMISGLPETSSYTDFFNGRATAIMGTSAYDFDGLINDPDYTLWFNNIQYKVCRAYLGPDLSSWSNADESFGILDDLISQGLDPGAAYVLAPVNDWEEGGSLEEGGNEVFLIYINHGSIHDSWPLFEGLLDEGIGSPEHGFSRDLLNFTTYALYPLKYLADYMGCSLQVFR